MRPDGFPRLQWHRHGRRAILPAAVPKGRAPCYITSTAVANTPILFSFSTSTVRLRCVLRCVACARVHAAPASPDVPDIVIAAAAGSDCLAKTRGTPGVGMADGVFPSADHRSLAPFAPLFSNLDRTGYVTSRVHNLRPRPRHTTSLTS